MTIRQPIFRIAPRYQFEVRIAIRMQCGETSEGWARDISESGMGAFVGHEISVGEMVVLTFRLSDSVRLALPAQAVSVVGTRCGFRFTALSAEQRADIQSAVRNRAEIAADGRWRDAGVPKGQPGATLAEHDTSPNSGISFAERAQKLIKHGFTPKVAVELALHEVEVEHGSHSWTMEKARIEGEEFLLKVRQGLI